MLTSRRSLLHSVIFNSNLQVLKFNPTRKTRLFWLSTDSGALLPSCGQIWYCMLKKPDTQSKQKEEANVIKGLKKNKITGILIFFYEPKG